MVKPRSQSRSSSSNNSDKKSKFSVYEFNLDDQRIEKDSQKLLSKFKPKNPKFSIDKYSFLRFFTRGAKAHENESQKEHVDIEDSDDNVEESVVELDTPVSSSARAPDEYLKSKCSFSREQCHARKGIKPKGRVISDEFAESSRPQIPAHNPLLCVDSDDDQGNENFFRNEPVCIDSDDDCEIDLRSSSSASDHGRHEGSLEEQASDHGSTAPLDIEPVVVVKPDFVTFGDIFSTSASLTFSRRFLRLEGSTLQGTKRPFSFVWSISDIVMINSLWCRKVETANVYLHLKSEDGKVAETDPVVSGIVKLNFSVCDPHWSEIQETIESLDMRYKATWKPVLDIDPIRSQFSGLEQKSVTFPEDCSSNVTFENIIYPEGDPDAVSISMKDIELLRPGSFLNDTIIDFYIKYLEQHIKPEEKNRFYFFNSFFFRKLADLDKDQSKACEGRAAFQRVRKWTRKVNLFEKEYLFIPVNFSLHWSLIVVCHPGEVANLGDDEMEKSFKVPCILHMDSIRGCHRGLKNLFQSYLLEEWRERHSKLPEDGPTKFLNLQFITLELPQQENSYDCGLFLLHYVERFLQQAPVNFSPSTASNFLNKDWFQPDEASSRRDHIKNIIHSIVKNNAQRDPLATSDNSSSCNTIKKGTGEELHLEICYGREACQGNHSSLNDDKEIEVISHVATPIRSLQSSGGPSLVPWNFLGQGDMSIAVAEGTYDQLVSVNRFCNIMSPIEEEIAIRDQTAFSSIDKASGGMADLTVSGTPTHREYDEVDSSSETSTGRFPIAFKVQDEGNFVPEVLLVSVSEERNKKNESCSMSSDEIDVRVVEDSLENEPHGINIDNAKNPLHDTKHYSMYDQEVESPCNTDVKANHKQPLAAGSEKEQDCVKLKSLTTRKETLTRFLSKDFSL